jgi:hypothetical protein
MVSRCVVGNVFGGASWAGAPRHESAPANLLGQALHVAAHGLQGDAQGVRQLLDRGGALGLHHSEQGQLAGVGTHGLVLRQKGGVDGL